MWITILVGCICAIILYLIVSVVYLIYNYAESLTDLQAGTTHTIINKSKLKKNPNNNTDCSFSIWFYIENLQQQNTSQQILFRSYPSTGKSSDIPIQVAFDGYNNNLIINYTENFTESFVSDKNTNDKNKSTKYDFDNQIPPLNPPPTNYYCITGGTNEMSVINGKYKYAHYNYPLYHKDNQIFLYCIESGKDNEKGTWFISYKPCHHSTAECFSKQHMDSVLLQYKISNNDNTSIIKPPENATWKDRQGYNSTSKNIKIEPCSDGKCGPCACPDIHMYKAEQGVCPLSHTEQLSNIESNIKCKDACDNYKDKKCTGFLYNNTNNTCKLYTNNMEQSKSMELNCGGCLYKRYESNSDIKESFYGGSPYTTRNIIEGATGTKSPTSKNPITVQNIPVNEWVNLVITLNKNTLDIYLNGKLTKTTILSSPISNTYTDIEITPSGGIHGWTSRFQYWNHTLSVSEVADIYKAGYRDLGVFGTLLNRYKLKISLLDGNTQAGYLEI